MALINQGVLTYVQVIQVQLGAGLGMRLICEQCNIIPSENPSTMPGLHCSEGVSVLGGSIVLQCARSTVSSC